MAIKPSLVNYRMVKLMPTLNTGYTKKILGEYYSLLGILIGAVLVSFSIGPFQNWDTQVEFAAASGVIRWGMPYVNYFSNLVNQPPLGFYVEALFFKVFGLSFSSGVILVTFFGLGCTVLVYKIGKDLYGKSTGLFAASLFALTPWQLILSRSFLIDVQCLFLSLLSLYVGIFAIRKDSVKLFVLSGTVFAAALLTKLFALFIIIPFLLLYNYYGPKNPRLILSRLVAFCLPVLMFASVWYQTILGRGVLNMFVHSDLSNLNVNGFVPNYFFVGTFLLNFGLGYVLIIATVFSLAVTLFFRKHFSKILFFDLICLITILSIVGLNTVLGAVLNFRSPYTNAIKYDYQSLPFFCLVAASLTGKSLSLLTSTKSKTQPKKAFFILLALTGVLILLAATFANFYYANQLSTSDYLVLRVRMEAGTGYSFFNYAPIHAGSMQMNLQYLGFMIVISGLLFAIRNDLSRFFSKLFQPMHRWIETKKANSRYKDLNLIEMTFQ